MKKRRRLSNGCSGWDLHQETFRLWLYPEDQAKSLLKQSFPAQREKCCELTGTSMSDQASAHTSALPQLLLLQPGLPEQRKVHDPSGLPGEPRAAPD
jgi:hypothetical protein